MLLTIATTTAPATDLGFLLHKHPERAQRFDLPVGRAHVFYPEASEHRCEAALLLEVDPIDLVRGGDRRGGFALSQYVNDRPYAATSMLASALGSVFRSALNGDCKQRPELPNLPRQWQISLPSLPAGDDPGLVNRLFEPLGWTVTVNERELDPHFPDWGSARCVAVELTGTGLLRDVLTQLYVLLPVLDNSKHYWISPEEVDKIVRRGEGWLPRHPERELILARYLVRRQRFIDEATSRLDELDGETMPDHTTDPVEQEADAQSDPRPPRLAVLRRQAMLAAIAELAPSSVLDLGCGEGLLLSDLRQNSAYTRILGIDVSPVALQRAARRLGQQWPEPATGERVELGQGALTYRDERLDGFDVAVLMEVIEHVDLDRLPALTGNLFGHARPGAVLITTPNADYNCVWESLPAEHSRHHDHRFEWSRAEFADWCARVGAEFSYSVRISGIGEEDPDHGHPTQMVAFTRVTDNKENR